MACWFRPSLTTGGRYIMHVGASTQNGGWNLSWLGDNTGPDDPIRAGTRTSGGAASDAVSTAGTTNGQWHHGVAVFAAANSRTIYLDGGNSATETTSRAAPTPTGIAIGGNVANNNFFGGDVAEAAVWDVALTAEEALMLAKGVSPLFVRPANLIAYCPLFGRNSPEIDLVSATPFTLTNSPVQAAHPRIILPAPARRIYLPSGGTSHAGSVDLAGAGAVAAAASRTTKAAAAQAGAGTIAAAAARTVRAAATLSATGVLSASATRTVHAAAAVAGAGALAADGQVAGDLAGSAGLAGAGGLAAAGLRTLRAAATLAATGVLSASATRTTKAAAAQAGAGTVAATAKRTARAAIVLAATGTLAASARMTMRGAVTLAGVASLAAAGDTDAADLAAGQIFVVDGYRPKVPVAAGLLKLPAVVRGSAAVAVHVC